MSSSTHYSRPANVVRTYKVIKDQFELSPQAPSPSFHKDLSYHACYIINHYRKL